jgi:hypothetical protein
VNRLDSSQNTILDHISVAQVDKIIGSFIARNSWALRFHEREDLVQEAWVNVIRYGSTYDPSRSRASTFVYNHAAYALARVNSAHKRPSKAAKYTHVSVDVSTLASTLPSPLTVAMAMQAEAERERRAAAREAKARRMSLGGWTRKEFFRQAQWNYVRRRRGLPECPRLPGQTFEQWSFARTELTNLEKEKKK